MTPESLTLQTSKYLLDDDWEYGREHDPVDSLDGEGEERKGSHAENASRRKKEAKSTSRGRRRSKRVEARQSEDHGVSLTVNDLEDQSTNNGSNDSSISGASAVSNHHNSTNSKNLSASTTSFVPPLHSEIRANMPSMSCPLKSKPAKKALIRNAVSVASSLIHKDIDANQSEVASELTLPNEICKAPPPHSAVRAKKPSFMPKSTNSGAGSGVDHHVSLPNLQGPKEEDGEQQRMHYSEIAMCDATDIVSEVTMPSTLNVVRAPPLLSAVLRRKPSDKIGSSAGMESHRHSQKTKCRPSDDSIPDSFMDESLAATKEPSLDNYIDSQRPRGDVESLDTLLKPHPEHHKSKRRSSNETPDSFLEDAMATSEPTHDVARREPTHDVARQHSHQQECLPHHHTKPQSQSAAKAPFVPKPPPPRPPPRTRPPKQLSSNTRYSSMLQSQPLTPLKEETCGPSPMTSKPLEANNSKSFELSDPVVALNDAAAQLLSLQSGRMSTSYHNGKNDGVSPSPSPSRSPKTLMNASRNFNQPVTAQLPFQTVKRSASQPTKQPLSQNLSRSSSQPTAVPGLLNQANMKARKSRVEHMPFVDDFGDSGLYSGEVNEEMRPNGNGKIKYDNGVFFDGKWKNGARESALGQRERMLKGFSSWKGAGKGNKTVHGMSWIDRFGKAGQYTGDVNEQSVPHGMGMMRYDFGLLAEGEWVNGMLIDSPQPGACLGVVGGMAGQTIVGGMPGQTVFGGMANFGGMTVMNPSYPQPMMMGNSMGNFVQGNMRGGQAGPPAFIGARNSE
jgi:hypothetical protein